MQTTINFQAESTAPGEYIIENNLLRVIIAEKGAELQHIIHKDFRKDFLWSGDAKFWGKKSPVLFPIVGTLKDNQYTFNAATYTLGRHGFARDMVFDVTWKKSDSILFTLNSNTQTLAVYPFDFSLSVKYALDNNELTVTYIVENKGTGDMYYSVGGHPAFAVPFVDNTNFEDYYLQFSNTEYINRWPLSADGLIETAPVPFFNRTRKLPLEKRLFYNDALVFKHPSSKHIYIRSAKTSHGIKMHFSDFPFLGIWSAKDADFVCLEPWAGIADSVNASGNIAEKEGINHLLPGGRSERSWSVELF